MSLTPVVLENGIVALAPRSMVNRLRPLEDNRMASAVVAALKLDAQRWPGVRTATWRDILHAETVAWENGATARRPSGNFDHSRGELICWCLIMGPEGFLTPYPATGFQRAGAAAVDAFGMTVQAQQAIAWSNEAHQVGMQDRGGGTSSGFPQWDGTGLRDCNAAI